MVLSLTKALVRDCLSLDLVTNLLLRREKGKPERLEKKRRDCGLRLVSMIEDTGESSGLGFVARRSCFYGWLIPCGHFSSSGSKGHKVHPLQP